MAKEAKSSKKTTTEHTHVKHASKKRACQVKGCKNEYRAKGYCDEHYKMWRKGAFGDARYQACFKEGCTKPTVREGLCQAHWNEKRGKGAPAAEAAPAAG